MNSSVKELTQILEDIGLSSDEAALFMKASLFPGLTPGQLRFQCGFSRMTTYRLLERLQHQGFISINKTGAIRKVFTIGLDELSKRLTSMSERLLKKASEIKLLNQISKFHHHEHDFNCEIFSAEKAVESYFDIHSLDWDLNLAIGSIEPILKRVGLPIMKKWPMERAKKGRKARAVITQMGPYTREVTKDNKKDLRQIQLAKTISMPNHQVEIFPDQDLTIIFSNNDEEDTWSLTKIKSKPITKSYESIIKSYF